jgi:hypothetical protein
MSARQPDPTVQTIEDAAYALAHVVDTRRDAPTLTVNDRQWLLHTIHERWPELSGRLHDIVTACGARPRMPMPRHFKENPDAIANRQHKAQLIAAWADRLSLTPEQLRLLEAALRGQRFAKLLGLTGTPSAETWARAVELLDQRRAATGR